MVKKRILIALVMLLALAGLAWFGFSTHSTKTAGQGHHGRYGGGQSPGGVPVLTAAAAQKNVAVTLQGVGTIAAYQTVTVQPQVSGKLLSIDFKEGQHVEKGQVLAKIDPITYKAQLEQTEAKLAMDQASLANARLDLKRYVKLARTNYVSKQQADQARATVRQDAAQVQSDKAAVDSAQATLGYTSIVAPISGRTGIRLVDAGNIVGPSDTNGIVVITQVQPITAVFTLPSDDIPQVHAAALRGSVPVRVVGANSDQVLDRGHLVVINNQVDTTTGTIKLKAVFPNAEQHLWPGQFVNIQLQVGTLDKATVVPVAAVQQGPNGAFVYRVGKNDTAQMQAVKVIQQNETEAVIAQGITPGERVITAGFGRLSDAAKVKPSPAENPQKTSDQGLDSPGPGSQAAPGRNGGNGHPRQGAQAQP